LIAVIIEALLYKQILLLLKCFKILFVEATEKEKYT